SLGAEMDDGSVVFGETAIPLAKGKIKQLRLQPEDPPALDDAVDEIRAADGIIIGPGSLFTSIIPNLLVRGIRQAVAEAAGCKLYICNVMTQPGETDGFDVLDHIQAIQDHAGPLFSHVLVNTAGAPQDVLEKYAEEGKYQVAADLEQLKQAGYQVISGDFLARGDLARHDSFKVATTIMEFVGSRLRKPGAAT
ncbi:MAG TPA: hypothetical protein DCG91_05285, partial [Clostridiales bacterium UBA9857]|nr:hypothetical protein [Clostridiales bacterium UBA9857]